MVLAVRNTCSKQYDLTKWRFSRPSHLVYGAKISSHSICAQCLRVTSDWVETEEHFEFVGLDNSINFWMIWKCLIIWISLICVANSNLWQYIDWIVCWLNIKMQLLFHLVPSMRASQQYNSINDESECF